MVSLDPAIGTRNLEVFKPVHTEGRKRHENSV
ncbi:hypothetical protein JOC78_001684 [Bacillus ectoiniformans]|nr:hypothetical protein [Bacillus ectoiniformans]